MIVCCPKCGESIYCMESKSEVPSTLYEACEFCDGKGYHSQDISNDYTAVPGGYTLSYTCASCNGTGRGKIKGFIE